MLPKLEQLTLDFTSCAQLGDVAALASLSNLPKLDQLALEFEYCPQLSDRSILTALASLAGMQPLEQLELHTGTSALGWQLSDKAELAAVAECEFGSALVC